jgi:hypothetical protein
MAPDGAALKDEQKDFETISIASGNLMENKLSFVTPEYGHNTYRGADHE